MGSKSDWDVMQHCCQTLADFGVEHEKRVLSAHRTPAAVTEFVATGEARGIKVFIAAAGGAASRGRDAIRGVGGQSAFDDTEPGRRPAVFDLRVDHDPQRRVLQVLELREYERLRVSEARRLTFLVDRRFSRLVEGHH